MRTNDIQLANDTWQTTTQHTKKVLDQAIRKPMSPFADSACANAQLGVTDFPTAPN